MSRSGEGVKHLVIQLIIATEVHLRPFAEVDDTRLAHTVGIVEDILEAEGVQGIGVFVVVGRVYKVCVITCGVADKADVGIIGYALVW